MSSLGKGLAEIDGMLAGCEYLDLYDQYSSRRYAPSPTSEYPDGLTSIPAYQRQETPDLGSFYRSRCSSKSTNGFASILNNSLSAKGAPLSYGSDTPRPSASQWEALQTLRDGVDIMFGHFENLAANDTVHSPIIDRLRETYGDSKGMRQSGLLTYKDILQGMAPENLRLEEIFAFSCLSYSLAKFLFVKGKLNETAVLGGLPSWRDAVAEEEKSAFDFIARSLWPEAGKILDSAVASDLPQKLIPDMELDSVIRDPQFIPCHVSLQFPADIPSADDFIPSISLTQSMMECDPSAWLIPIPDLALQDQALDLMLESNNTFGFEKLSAAGGVDSYSPNNEFSESQCPSLVDSPPNTQSPPPVDFTIDTQTPPPLSQRLQSTDMFRVVSVWFSHLRGLQELLWTLSGDGAFSHKMGSRPGFAVMRHWRQFQDIMMDQFFAPFSEVLPATMVDILRLTKSRVLDGVLSSLRDVEDHLFAISRAFGIPPETRKWFLEMVLNRCLKLSRTMKSCIYTSKAQDLYTEDYVQNKLDACFGNSVSSLSSPSSSVSMTPSPPRRLKRSTVQETDDDLIDSTTSRGSKKTPRVSCPICGKSYSGHSNLSRHKKQEHRQGKPPSFRCEYPGCEKICSRADNLKQHVELVHKKHIGQTDMIE